MATYRRGSVFWWKARLRFLFVPSRPIMVRMSLRTTSPSQARARSAKLDLIRDAFMEQPPILRHNMKADDLAGLYKRAFERELDRIILAQVRNPKHYRDHRSTNLHYARYMTLLATDPELLDGSLESAEELLAQGLGQTDVDALAMLAQRHRSTPPVSARHLADDLRSSGIEPTQANLETISRLSAAAYRNANITACDELGLPIAHDEIWPLPPQLQRIADAAERSGLASTQPAAPAATGAPSPMASPLPPLSPQAPHLHLVTEASPGLNALRAPPAVCASTGTPQDQANPLVLSAVAAATLSKKIADGAWDKGRRRDIDTAVAIFIAANGDIPINTMRQHHLIAMKDLFLRLPREYGRMRTTADGRQVRETISEALERGDRLLAQWQRDPVKAEIEQLPYVGLSLVTQKKHLTWISALVTHIEGHIPDAMPIGLNFKAVRKALVQPRLQGERHTTKPGQKKNEGRLPWKAEELARLFHAPIWHGCADLRRRLAPGEHVYHDGNYWALMLLVSTAARADEICGLAVNDVVSDGDVPHLIIRDTFLRRVKNQSSVRKVPIAARIIELGFLNYVSAISKAGHPELFPEYRHPTMGFDKVFYKDCFQPLRAYSFPKGTSRMRGRKDVDVQSIRTFGLSELKRKFELEKDPAFDKQHRLALAGHEPGDTGSKHYEDDFEPGDLLAQANYLASFLPDLPRRPLNLRPEQFRKFGKRRMRHLGL